MFLFRLGKDKLLFTLTLALQKLKYSHTDTLNSSHQLQIDIERGAHRLKFLSQVNKKGQIKAEKASQHFPMTLYYDKGSKKFEKKQMIIKGKVIDEFDQTITDLGQAEMDVAQYASQTSTENLIQIQLYGSKDQVCKVVFNIKIQRTNEGCFTQTETINSQEKGTARSKKKYDTVSKQYQNSQNQQKSQVSVARTNKSKEKSLKQYQNTLARNKMNKVEQKKQKRGNQLTVRSDSVNKQDFQPISQDNQTVEFNKQTPPKLKINQNPIQPSSVELKLFQTERMLRQKTKELTKVKKELQAQKNISESLLNQQRKQQNITMSNQTLKQMQSLKTQLMVANMKLSDYQAQSRKCNKKLDESQFLNEKQAQQLSYYKKQLQKEKGKMAEVFQMALQRGESDLISFLEQLATQQ